MSKQAGALDFIRYFAYRNTCGFVAQDMQGDITEIRFEFMPRQLALGLRGSTFGADTWTIEVLLPFATVTLSKNEVPF